MVEQVRIKLDSFYNVVHTNGTVDDSYLELIKFYANCLFRKLNYFPGFVWDDIVSNSNSNE